MPLLSSLHALPEHSSWSCFQSPLLEHISMFPDQGLCTCLSVENILAPLPQKGPCRISKLTLILLSGARVLLLLLFWFLVSLARGCGVPRFWPSPYHVPQKLEHQRWLMKSLSAGERRDPVTMTTHIPRPELDSHAESHGVLWLPQGRGCGVKGEGLLGPSFYPVSALPTVLAHLAPFSPGTLMTCKLTQVARHLGFAAPAHVATFLFFFFFGRGIHPLSFLTSFPTGGRTPCPRPVPPEH